MYLLDEDKQMAELVKVELDRCGCDDGVDVLDHRGGLPRLGIEERYTVTTPTPDPYTPTKLTTCWSGGTDPGSNPPCTVSYRSYFQPAQRTTRGRN